MGQLRHLLFIFILFKQIFTEKTVDISRIRTRIVGVEGEHADHLTTTMTPNYVWMLGSEKLIVL